MNLRYQADADLNEDIVDGVIRIVPEIDFQTAHEANLKGIPDPEVLSYAAKEERILVSSDARTMPYHFADFITHTNSPGVILVPQNLSVGQAIDELVLIADATQPEECINCLVRLPL